MKNVVCEQKPSTGEDEQWNRNRYKELWKQIGQFGSAETKNLRVTASNYAELKQT
jgi:hypothetical protein